MSMEVVMHDEVIDRSFWRFNGEVKYVDDWFLMRTPIPMLLITTGYLLFILKLGRDYMKNKPAYKLNIALPLYNAAQVLFSCYMCYVGTKLILQNGLIYTPCLMDKEDLKLVVTSSIHIYFTAKLSELSDTIFFVLKKNYRQITFLHVYHHLLMFWCTWYTLKYEPTYNTIFLGTLNSYVHVVMYTYYGLSAVPGLSKYLWWKKYITKMQITQFLLIILQAFGSYICSGCPLSYTLLTVICINGLLFIALFTNFYVNSYKKSKNVE